MEKQPPDVPRGRFPASVNHSSRLTYKGKNPNIGAWSSTPGLIPRFPEVFSSPNSDGGKTEGVGPPLVGEISFRRPATPRKASCLGSLPVSGIPCGTGPWTPGDLLIRLILGQTVPSGSAQWSFGFPRGGSWPGSFLAREASERSERWELS